VLENASGKNASMTGVPLRSESFTLLPDVEGKVKSGAG